MKKIFFSILMVALVSGCLADIKESPLTSTEEKLLGTWSRPTTWCTYTWDFQDDRRVYWNRSHHPIYGSASAVYVWQADNTTLTIYESEGIIAVEEETYTYSFPDKNTLLLNTSLYEKQ